MARYKIAAIAILGVWVLGQAASLWVGAGLQDRSINCLLADRSGRLLAGTDQGLRIFDGSSWLSLNGATSLPVNGITEAGAGTVVVSAGNGSKSDGLYIGHEVDGAPYYEFNLLGWFMRPGPLASRIRNALPGTGIQIFAGQGGAVFTGVIFQTVSGGAVVKEEITLAPMKQPPWCFGVEQPLCAALHIYSADGACYAGGYDAFRGNPGPGSLIWEVSADSLRTKRARMNVSCFAEGMLSSAAMPYYQGTPRLLPVLFVGTIDSGVFAYAAVSDAKPSPAQHWLSLGSPSHGPVTALLAVGASTAGEDMLYAATAAGVYRKCGPNMNCLWQPVGAIPAAPTALAVAGKDSLLYAGTDKGVYVYKDATAAALSCQDRRDRRQRVLAARKGAAIAVPPKVAIKLYDVTGRILRGAQAEYAMTFLDNLGAGLYFYTIEREAKIIGSSFLGSDQR